MRAELEDAIATALGSGVVGARPVSGGSINECFACELEDGRTVFVKGNTGCDPRMFPAEARGLSWLAAAGALRVPEVLAVSAADDGGEPFLVLEHLEPGPRARGYDEQLGRGLARLHQCVAPCFGLDENNFLATLEQDNRPEEDWPTFYRRRRLEPQLRLAIDAGHAPHSWVRRFDRIFDRLADLCGPAEPAARLHGDLWSGNLHADPDGAPVLIDPAVYGGHREIDLAMIVLFGAPGPRFFAAYDESHPRAPGHAERLPLYQLYPLLAHVNLFGTSYVGSVEAALARLS